MPARDPTSAPSQTPSAAGTQQLIAVSSAQLCGLQQPREGDAAAALQGQRHQGSAQWETTTMRLSEVQLDRRTVSSRKRAAAGPASKSKKKGEISPPRLPIGCDSAV